MSEEEFWQCDPEFWVELWKRRVFDVQMQQLVIARVAAVWINSQGSTPVTANDFLAFPFEESIENKRANQESERLARLFDERMMMKALKHRAEAQQNNGVR